MSELLYYDLKDTAGVVPSLSTQVCRELGRRIVGGVVREGDLIDDENKLCERFGVSKSVVREAVKLLVAKGLLEVKRGSGTRVRRRASWNLLDDDVLAWHLSVEPRPSFLNQLLDVRQVFEPSAAAWAANSATKAQIDEIRAAQQKMESASEIQDYVVADALFHRAVLRAANNEVLMAMEGVIFSALLSSIRLTNADPRDNKRSVPLHQKVLAAIEAQDAPAAEAAMKEHLEDTRERLAHIMSGTSGK
ncbi:FadR/GntR family transcriptional regulator [uncultured Roseibium sp.]|uniref:FadR/GntR family transcriptional regulator n=1 Tax=uncultured Roseibium sp. TaxID=1936171 RepID=UPI00263113E6|nr:FadR/GntR family transcriptional regulator [uncultured Roseibium sp.]